MGHGCRLVPPWVVLYKVDRSSNEGGRKETREHLGVEAMARKLHLRLD